MRTKIFSTLLSIIVLFPAHSQTVKKLMEEADMTLYREQFEAAIAKYDEVLDKKPDHSRAKYHQLIAKHLSSFRGKDLKDLLAFEDTQGHTDKFYNYWMGRVHLVRYEFELAERHFDAFLDLDTYKSKEIINETLDFKDIIARAKDYYNHPSEFELEQLDYPINSKHADLSPGYFNDHNELVFTSSRPTSDWKKSPNDFLVFHTLKKSSNGWSTPEVLRNIGVLPFNAPRVEVVNEDGKLFIYKNQNGGDLFFSSPKEFGWTIPEEFDSKITTTRLESDFFINDEENQILFASKRGGNGLDIYESVLKIDGTWSTPKPIAGKVNSRFDEDSPFISHDGQTLYFSSNRPESMGGFDVFQSQYNSVTKTWSEPVNLGFPINTIDDEINYQLQEDNLSGFLSSNRLHSLGDYDIYYFHKEGQAKLKGTIVDEKGQPMANAIVKYHPEKYLDESFSAMTDENGNYQLQLFSNESYRVEVFDDLTLVHEDKFNSTITGHNKLLKNDLNLVEVVKKEQTDFVALYEGGPEEQSESLSMLGSKFRVGQKAVLRNIYFQSGSAAINLEAAPVIEQVVTVLTDYPEIKLEIGGHTDNRETRGNRNETSLMRAETVKNQLVLQGIDPSRVVTRGYADSEPLASNDDEEDGRELNRRIEVRVIE